MSAFAHVPPGRFWAHEDTCHDYQSREHRRGHHQSPVQPNDPCLVLDFIQTQIRGVSNEDPESSPDLPLHDKSAADPRRRCFRGEDRDGGRFGSDAKAEEESGDKHVPPGIGEGLPEAGQSREETGEEDGTSSTKEAVEWNGEPAPKKGTTKVRSRIEETGQPCRSRVVAADAVLVFIEKLTPIPEFFVSTSFLAHEIACCVLTRQFHLIMQVSPESAALAMDDVPMPCTAAHVEQTTMTMYSRGG